MRLGWQRKRVREVHLRLPGRRRHRQRFRDDGAQAMGDGSESRGLVMGWGDQSCVAAASDF
jgi:hypothetical protein